MKRQSVWEEEKYESAESETPLPRSPISPLVFAIGSIILAFLVVGLAYYLMIYESETAQHPLPEKKVESKGPDLSKVYKEVQAFAAEHPEDYHAVIEHFEKVADEALRDTPYEQKCRDRAEEIRKKWQGLADEALASSKAKSEELFKGGDFDGALKAVQDVPEKLLPPVKEQIEDSVAVLHSSAKEQIEGVFGGAEDLLVAGEFDKSLDVVGKASVVKYEPAAAEIAERIEAFRKKVASRKLALKEAREREIQARLDAYLADFDILLAQGKFKDACSNARDSIEKEKAKGKEKIDSIVAAMESAAQLADVLLKRVTAVQNAKLEWVGKEVTLKTSAGEKKGVVQGFGDEEIDLDVEIRQLNIVATKREKIKFPDLEEGEMERLLPAPLSTRLVDWLADAVTAIAKGKTDTAKKVIVKAEGHLLAEHYGDRLDVKLLGVPEAAAKKFWRERLAPLATGEELSSEDAARASRALAEFKTTHGATEFAKTVEESIGKLEEKVKKALTADELEKLEANTAKKEPPKEEAHPDP